MGSEMKALMAILVLLCLSSTVLAHDIYSNLRDRDGHLCCGGQDCRPVQVTVLPNGNYFLPETAEIIPAEMAHHHLGRQSRQSIHLILRPTVFDRRSPKQRDELAAL